MEVKQYLKKILMKYPKLFYWIKYRQYLGKVKKLDKMTLEDKKMYLNNMYYKIFNRNIDWNNPQTYNEKIQISKLFGQDNELKARLADKYLVREWVSKTIGNEYLIPLIGVYDSFEEIPFESLPSQFVIKCNHDSGSTTIVKKKNLREWKQLKYKYKYHMKTDFSKFTLETHYSMIKPKILIEKYIRNEHEDLPDYKFICFNSIPYFFWIDINRQTDQRRNTYNMDLELQTWTSRNLLNSNQIAVPDNIEEMIRVVKKLCSGFNEVRVDLYNINGKIYFGEMTFTDGSGFAYLDSDTDKMLGELWRN